MNSTKKVKVFCVVRQMFQKCFFIMRESGINEGEETGEKLSALFDRR
jgi:hypothetical protein